MFTEDFNYYLLFFGLFSFGVVLDKYVYEYRMKSIKWPQTIDKLIIGLGT